MPNWKKLIVSGSDAALSSLNVTNAVTAGDLKIDTQRSQDGSAARAFIYTTSGTGGAKFKVFKNTNTTDGYARFKVDRAYDYGNSDQTVQEAIYQRRTTTKNVKFRYDGDVANTEDVFLEFYELSDGTVEAWLCHDDYAKSFITIFYDAVLAETYPKTSAGTPTGTLIHTTNPDTATPNWDISIGAGTFSGNVGIGTTSPGASLEVVGNISASLAITASAFVGDGSALTGIDAGGFGYSNPISMSADTSTTAGNYTSIYGPIQINSGVTFTVAATSLVKVETF